MVADFFFPAVLFSFFWPCFASPSFFFFAFPSFFSEREHKSPPAGMAHGPFHGFAPVFRALPGAFFSMCSFFCAFLLGSGVEIVGCFFCIPPRLKVLVALFSLLSDYGGDPPIWLAEAEIFPVFSLDPLYRRMLVLFWSFSEH